MYAPQISKPKVATRLTTAKPEREPIRPTLNPGANATRWLPRSARPVGSETDACEVEAEHVSEQVVSGLNRPTFNASPLWIQRAFHPAKGQTPSPTSDSDPLPAGSGSPLDPLLRYQMEERFGADFSHVRLHSGLEAEELAQRERARAYTLGSEIVFGRGQYSPDTASGRRLLAHELTHVVQQQRGAGSKTSRGGPGAVIQRSPLPESSGERSAGPTAGVTDGPGSPLDQFFSAAAAVQEREQAIKIAAEAFARMMAEKGNRLAEIEHLERYYRRSEAHFADTKERMLNSLEAERREILETYDPASRGMSRLPSAAFIRLPYSAQMVPTHSAPSVDWAERVAAEANAQHGPNINPTKMQSFGKYGGREWDQKAVRTSTADAYTYDIETNFNQVADDLDRIARAGYTEIHIATGTHGGPFADLAPERVFFRQDARSIMDTMQRHPGLQIISYDMSQPARAAQFYAKQLLAAEGRLPGAATLGAYCYSCTSIDDFALDQNRLYPSTELLADPHSKMPKYLGGLSIGAGALGIWGGLQDPNSTIGAVKVGSGVAQVAGGMSYMAGYARDSLRMVRAGSALTTAGNYVTAPLAVVDFYREMRQKFEPGASLKTPWESLDAGINSTLMLAGAFFWQAAVGAATYNFVAKPAVEKASEIATPIFVEGISRMTGIPSQYLWGMH